MKMLLNQLLMKTEKVAEPPENFHLRFAEIRNVRLQNSNIKVFQLCVPTVITVSKKTCSNKYEKFTIVDLA